MAIAIDKSHREQAKREGNGLFQILLDSKYISKEDKEKLGIISSVSVSGAASLQRSKELYDLMRRWLTEDSEVNDDRS